MLLTRIATFLIGRAERRVGVGFDYVRRIAQIDLGLLGRYNKIFGFLDPNTKVPAPAYHVARLRGAVAADCGTCVEAEINLALRAGVDVAFVDRIVSGDYRDLPVGIAAVATLADAVAGRRDDAPEARERVRQAYGEAGLIEIAFAMNGAALLPGIKRAMGFVTACDLDILRKQVRRPGDPTPRPS
ncbi:hypothetical protein [Methylobacterium platani]|uniref:Carboxymuconolactone decarboxylase-like domain-containing protein n=1 Tax=Methylobacterium platani TaxID=427683 RepID=A0A179SBR7_9HYPH|nr:hypothetical protein [Methylobacterium platani]OAS25297.1 hypothetical protein A5481_10310 [Methylobacterium platani]